MLVVADGLGINTFPAPPVLMKIELLSGISVTLVDIPRFVFDYDSFNHSLASISTILSLCIILND